MNNVVKTAVPKDKPSSAFPKELLGPPGDFNPTVLLFLAAIILLVASTFGYWCWEWPDWSCFSVNILALHLLGPVIHDASHSVAHRNRIVNAGLGQISAFLQGFPFAVFTRVHRQHHTHVNDPENDPDHFVSTGGPLWLISFRFLCHEVFFFRRRLWQNYDLVEWGINRVLMIAIVCVALQQTKVGFLINYWFSPALVVGLIYGLTFDYFPHRPFEERDRWKNARVYPSRLLNVLILGQNYHLIHHLWPTIPWYKWQTAYYATQSLLTSKGCYQTLGISNSKDVSSFIYDAFLGIHFKPQRRSITPVEISSAD